MVKGVIPAWMLKDKLENRTWNYYLASTCFVRIVEEQYEKHLSLIPFSEIEQLYAIWKDGYRLGKYDETTKDAEGS